ncbi:hypothetical protein NPIL_668061 [Nephila pilipes]|uniref:Uncharacterized protein n=1 Tax=Nephila pilipes TaxID=299642 RepID=A0A8X6TPN2_NEPPI|nr:hypothetical protein NPIL_668061 [Nephila pilipes]
MLGFFLDKAWCFSRSLEEMLLDFRLILFSSIAVRSLCSALAGSRCAHIHRSQDFLEHGYMRLSISQFCSKGLAWNFLDKYCLLCDLDVCFQVLSIKRFCAAYLPRCSSLLNGSWNLIQAYL